LYQITFESASELLLFAWTFFRANEFKFFQDFAVITIGESSPDFSLQDSRAADACDDYGERLSVRYQL